MRASAIAIALPALLSVAVCAASLSSQTPWRAASEGVMQMDKIAYRSKVGDLEIPAFVFQPLKLRGAHGHPAIVWVHENIRGHLYEHYIPYTREATAKGYVVIAPEYRGSIDAFDRRVEPGTWRPENTREQRDSWNRVWTFLDWNLDQFHGASPVSTK